MNKAIEIIVKGEVQKVNFRDFVREFAKECKVLGFVENLENLDEDVRIVAEGPNENLQKFLLLLEKLKDESTIDSGADLPVIVELIVKEQEFSGQYKGFKIVRGQDEVGERMIKAYDILVKILNKLDEHSHIMKSHLNALEEQKQVTEEHKQVTENFKDDSNKKFQEFFSKMDQQRKTTEDHKHVTEKLFEETVEHKNITENFRNDSNKNFNKLFNETHEHRNLTEKFKEDSNSNFAKLDTKYGKISGKLSELTETIKDSNKKLEKLDEIKDNIKGMKGSLERIEKKF